MAINIVPEGEVVEKNSQQAGIWQMNRLDEYIEKMYSLKYFIRLPVRKITFSHLTIPRRCLRMVLLTWLHA